MKSACWRLFASWILLIANDYRQWKLRCIDFATPDFTKYCNYMAQLSRCPSIKVQIRKEDALNSCRKQRPIAGMRQYSGIAKAPLRMESPSPTCRTFESQANVGLFLNTANRVVRIHLRQTQCHPYTFFLGRPSECHYHQPCDRNRDGAGNIKSAIVFPVPGPESDPELEPKTNVSRSLFKQASVGN